MMIKTIVNKIGPKFVVGKSERSSLKGRYFLNKYFLEYDRCKYHFSRGFVKGNKILDIACGEGYGSFILGEDMKMVVYGIDRSSEAISTAKKNFHYKNLIFNVGDAYRTPFKKEFFTSVVSLETIEHLEYPDRFLSELNRILKKDGRLVISTPNKSVESRIFDRPYHLSLMSKKEMVSLLERHFTIIGLYYHTPIIKKPFFMPYLTYIFSSIFLSKSIVHHKKNLTGANYIFICEKR